MEKKIYKLLNDQVIRNHKIKLRMKKKVV